MFSLFSVIGAVIIGKELFKEATQKEIPAEYWNNTELVEFEWKNLPHDVFFKNLRNGRYYAPEKTQKKAVICKPVIRDKKEYEKDVKEYGQKVADAMAEQGFYKYIRNMDENE